MQRTHLIGSSMWPLPNLVWYKLGVRFHFETRADKLSASRLGLGSSGQQRIYSPFSFFLHYFILTFSILLLHRRCLLMILWMTLPATSCQAGCQPRQTVRFRLRILINFLSVNILSLSHRSLHSDPWRYRISLSTFPRISSPLGYRLRNPPSR